MLSLTGQKINLRKRSGHKHIVSPPKRHAPSNIPAHSQRLLLEQLLHLRNYSRGFGETRGDSTFKRQRASKRKANPSSLSSNVNNPHNLRGRSTFDSFQGVWNNRFSCFILDGRDIYRPEDRGYADEECVVCHVPSRTHPAAHLELVQVLAWKDGGNTLAQIPEEKLVTTGGQRQVAENLHMMRALVFVYNMELRTGPRRWKNKRITFCSAQSRTLLIALSCTRRMAHHP